MISRLLAAATLAAGALMAVPAQAVVLTFDGSICGPTGNGLCGNGNQIGTNYGSGGGAVVSYKANVNNALSNNFLYFWSTQYSDLTNVAYGDSGGMPEIFIAPTAGNSITLNSFELGAWPNQNRNTQVTILDGLGNTLFSSGAITVLGTTASLFDDGWSSVHGIRIQFGPDGFNVGIDNIDFTVSQVNAVPEPATWAMMLIGFAGLGYAARRRKEAAAA